MSDDKPARGGRFATTRWSLVLAAGQRWNERSREALNSLCETYLDTSRIKVANGGGVRATILGVGSGLIVGGLSPRPELDRAALMAVCRELGVPLP
jgi:hypothetical protein